MKDFLFCIWWLLLTWFAMVLFLALIISAIRLAVKIAKGIIE
jgi:hypothetical protein